MIRAFPAKPPGVIDAARITLTALALLLALGVAVWAYRDMRTGMVLVGGLVFLVTAAWRPSLLPAGYLFLICLVPLAGTLAEPDPFPVHFHPLMFPPMFAAMALLMQAGRILDPDGLDARPNRPDFIGVVIGLFLIWGVFTYLRGYAVGNPERFMLWEIAYLLTFFSYYYWRAFLRRQTTVMPWVYLLILLGVLTAGEFAALAARQFTDIASFVLFRVLTRQSQVPLFALPLVAWFLFTRKTTRGRVLGVTLLFLIVAHVFLTQQRSLWVAVVGMGVLFFTFFIFRKGFNGRSMAVWLVTVTLTVGFFAGVLYTAAWLFDTDLTVLLKRWEDVESLRDESFLMRVFDWRRAYDAVGPEWYWGRGGGELMSWVHTGFQFFYFDISYGIAYFKGGVPYALLLTLVYLSLAWQGFRLYLSRAIMEHRLLGATITSIIAGQMVMGLFSTSMVYYRFIFIWMLLGAIATVLLERAKEAEENAESSHLLSPATGGSSSATQDREGDA